MINFYGGKSMRKIFLLLAAAVITAVMADISISAITPNPLLSRGKTVYSNVDQTHAYRLTDGSYGYVNWANNEYFWNGGTAITPANPSWFAINIGTGYSKLLLKWDDWASDGGMGYMNISMGAPGDYQLQVSSNSTNGADGTWSTVVTVTGNIYVTREHSFNFTGKSWVRMYITAANLGSWAIGAIIDEVDIFDVSNGSNDSWAFIGDSITQGSYCQAAGSGGVRRPSFQDNITSSFPANTPITIDCGIGGSASGGWVGYLDTILPLNPDIKYWCIGLGTNDGEVTSTYKGYMQAIVDKIKAAGRVPIIARILPGQFDCWSGFNALMNDHNLYGVIPLTQENSLIPGPDQWTFFSNHTEAAYWANCIHPNELGGIFQNRLWSDAVSFLYATGNDTTPPSAPGTVRDGSGNDIASTASTTQLEANWSASSDPDSGISGYKYAIGTTAGATNTVGWTTLANVTSITRTGLTLAIGATYYFSVKAVNGVLLESTASNSNGQFVTGDITPPSVPAAVRDGTGTDIASTLLTTQLSANWDASSDPDSGISGYKYAIGTSAGATNITNWTAIGNITAVNKTGLTLTVGTTYYFSVKAINGVLLESAARNSNGQFVRTDTTPPSAPGAVRDGTGSDAASTSIITQLSANWDASSDPESGISAYKYAIGTAMGGTDIAGWTTIGNMLSETRASLTLIAGTTYYFSVKAVNGVGLESPATNSNGQFVRGDTTPPSAPGTVRDGTGSDIASTTLSTSLSANWTASSDAESNILGYKYAIGTSAGATNTLGWTAIGNVTTITKTGLTLTAGTTYYFSVKAVNGVSMESAAANSNGQFVASTPAPGDTTPPVITAARANDIQGTSVLITWTTDEPSTSRVFYGQNTSYGSNTAEDPALLTSHSVRVTGLSPEIKYHCKAQSRDAAGNAADSPDISFTTALTDELGAKVYPNPFIITPGAKMNFSLSSSGGIVEIYTISGKLVQSIPIAPGNTVAQWDLLNGAGNTIKNGIYIYVAKDSAGNRKTGKIAITN
jgi:acyl-CoA thioesterase I